MGGSKRKKDVIEDDSESSSMSKKRRIEDSSALPVSDTDTTAPLKEPPPSASDDSQDEMERLQLLVSAFSNSQQDQYEVFRRSTFPKAAIKKIMQSVSGVSVPQNAVIAMAGIAKVYVGEIVEEACAARDGVKEVGPLQPKHVREAVRRLKNANKVPNSRYKRVFP